MRVAFVPRSAEIKPLFWRFVPFAISRSRTPPYLILYINDSILYGTACLVVYDRISTTVQPLVCLTVTVREP